MSSRLVYKRKAVKFGRQDDFYAIIFYIKMDKGEIKREFEIYYVYDNKYTQRMLNEIQDINIRACIKSAVYNMSERENISEKFEYFLAVASQLEFISDAEFWKEYYDMKIPEYTVSVGGIKANIRPLVLNEKVMRDIVGKRKETKIDPALFRSKIIKFLDNKYGTFLSRYGHYLSKDGEVNLYGLDFGENDRYVLKDYDLLLNTIKKENNVSYVQIPIYTKKTNYVEFTWFYSEFLGLHYLSNKSSDGEYLIIIKNDEFSEASINFIRKKFKQDYMKLILVKKDPDFIIYRFKTMWWE